MAFEQSIGSTQLHLAEDTAYIVLIGEDHEEGKKLECDNRSCDVIFKRKPDPQSIMKNEWVTYNFSLNDMKGEMILEYAFIKLFNRDTIAMLSGGEPATDYRCDTLDKTDFISFYEGMKYRLMTDTLIQGPFFYERPTCCRFESNGYLRPSFERAPYLDLYKTFRIFDTLPYKHFPFTEHLRGAPETNHLWVTIYCEWASLNKFYLKPRAKSPPDWDADLCDLAYYIQFKLMQERP
jgi:hypothetical protein